MIVALLWTGCKAEREDEPTQKMKLPVMLCLSAEDVHASNGARRVMGDPGTQERFSLPTHIYFFIVKKEGGVWKLWEKQEKTPTEEEWIKQYYSGSLMGNGDSIYRYKEEIVIPLVDKVFEGRIYAIASSVALSFDATLAKGSSTLDDVLNLKFSTSGETMQQNLQNIYSTPHNYIVDEKYYGAFESTEDDNVPIVFLLLYHVAAKVDIKWNVADEARIKAEPAEAVRLTYMKACNLFNDSAYCFKPMSNTAAEPVTSTDSVTIITPADEGLWWEGRSYFYTIPYTTPGRAGHFPLQMKMGTNDSTKYYKPTIYLNIESDTTFVPWLRVNFNLTQPLTEGSRDI